MPLANGTGPRRIRRHFTLPYNKISEIRPLPADVSKVQHSLALGPRRLEYAILLEGEDRLDDLFGLIDDLDEVEIVFVDHSFADEAFPGPIDQSLPEASADENDRYLAVLAGLHERQAFRELVERSEAAGKHDVRRGETHEHHLARKKVAKVEAYVLVIVAALLARQQDVEADRRGSACEGPTI